MKRSSRAKAQVTERPKKLYTQADMDKALQMGVNATEHAVNNAKSAAHIEGQIEASRAEVATIVGILDTFKEIPDAAILIAGHQSPAGHGGVTEVKTAAISMGSLRKLANAARNFRGMTTMTYQVSMTNGDDSDKKR